MTAHLGGISHDGFQPRQSTTNPALPLQSAGACPNRLAICGTELTRVVGDLPEGLPALSSSLS
jgi:hypothetical protein